jgi:hypothetical protein
VRENNPAEVRAERELEDALRQSDEILIGYRLREQLRTVDRMDGWKPRNLIDLP